MRRMTALFCAMLLFVGTLSFPVFSSSPEASFSVNVPESVSLGEEFEVVFTFTPAEGVSIGAWLISLSYHTGALTYLSGADQVENGTLRLCDSPESPSSSLTFTLRFRAVGGSSSLHFDGVQLVDFATAKPLDVATFDVPVSVLIDPEGLGDLDESGSTDSDDAIYLLFYTLFPEDYPIAKKADYDKNGSTDSDDAIYLLFYTLFPLDYPL